MQAFGGLRSLKLGVLGVSSVSVVMKSAMILPNCLAVELGKVCEPQAHQNSRNSSRMGHQLSDATEVLSDIAEALAVADSPGLVPESAPAPRRRRIKGRGELDMTFRDFYDLAPAQHIMLGSCLAISREL